MQYETGWTGQRAWVWRSQERAGSGGVASAGYRWYLGAQVVSLAGTTMGYTSLFWLVLHIPTAALVVSGVALQLLAVSATVYIQQATPAAQRGLALSAYNAGFIGFVPAGAFAVARIASLAGSPGR